MAMKLSAAAVLNVTFDQAITSGIDATIDVTALGRSMTIDSGLHPNARDESRINTNARKNALNFKAIVLLQTQKKMQRGRPLASGEIFISGSRKHKYHIKILIRQFVAHILVSM
jgi:hypothetical protein